MALLRLNQLSVNFSFGADKRRNYILVSQVTALCGSFGLSGIPSLSFDNVSISFNNFNNKRDGQAKHLIFT